MNENILAMRINNEKKAKRKEGRKTTPRAEKITSRYTNKINMSVSNETTTTTT